MRTLKLGEKIRRLRGDKAYAEVARAAQCSAPTIRELEADLRTDPSVRIIRRIAAFFGVSLDWLADDSADWPPPATPEQTAAEMVRSALERGGLAGELSDQERELLTAFRSLGAQGRAQAVGYMAGLSSAAGAEPREGIAGAGQRASGGGTTEELRRTGTG